MFKKVGVAGLGFIGGSLALAIRKKFTNVELVGITRDPIKVKSCEFSKYIDFITDYSNLDILRDLDFVIICSNVSYIPEIFGKFEPFLSGNCLVTDVGSVKEFVVKSINNPRFVGSHPMSGSDKTGFENSDPSIFDGALSIVTPFNNDSRSVDVVVEFWKLLGMEVLIISPEEHDKITSQTSHFIHLVAYTISYTLSSSEFAKERFKGVFSKGLLDTTRVSKSDPNLWIDIISKNKENVYSILDKFINNLNYIKELVNKEDFPALENIFRVSKLFRDGLDQK